MAVLIDVTTEALVGIRTARRLEARSALVRGRPIRPTIPGNTLGKTDVATVA
jgi:hypothetical protein